MTEKMYPHVVDVHALVGRYPGGRYREHSATSAEALRDDVIIPALQQHGSVVIKCDGDQVIMGSSWLEELLGGILRNEHYKHITQRGEFDKLVILNFNPETDDLARANDIIDAQLKRNTANG